MLLTFGAILKIFWLTFVKLLFQECHMEHSCFLDIRILARFFLEKTSTNVFSGRSNKAHQPTEVDLFLRSDCISQLNFEFFVFDGLFDGSRHSGADFLFYLENQTDNFVGKGLIEMVTLLSPQEADNLEWNPHQVSNQRDLLNEEPRDTKFPDGLVENCHLSNLSLKKSAEVRQ